MKYIHRKAENSIVDILRSHLIAILSGPRQSGKTTILKYLADKFRSSGAEVFFVDGDYPDQWDTLFDVLGIESRIELLPESRRVYFIIDELQKIENGGTALKRLYDKFRNRIGFIATGSTFLWGRDGIGENLTGRALEINVLPLSLVEIVEDELEIEIIPENFEKVFYGYYREIESIWNHAMNFGLFPNVYLSKVAEKENAIRSIATGFINRDIYSILPRGDWHFFRSLMQILSTDAGILNISRIGRELRESDRTVRTYIDMAERLFILKLIKPTASSSRVALRKSPRVLFSDCGLVRMFSGEYKVPDGIAYEQVVGAEIWKAGYEIHYWRTKSDAEVDFVIGRDRIPIEVKKGYTGYKLTRGFRSFIRAYNPPIAFWLRPGETEIRKVENTDVYMMPAPMFALGLQARVFEIR